MKFLKAADFTGVDAWDARDIADVEGASVRLHWTDKPYIWHENEGEEVFVVLDGIVQMHYRKNGQELVKEMRSGDIFHAGAGEEHVAHPEGPARILVIEKKGSV